jgi:hypothetical protein
MTLQDLALRGPLARAALAAATLAFALSAHADAVTDWNQKVCDVAVDARLGTPPSLRTMATAQTAVYVATNAITRRYPPGPYAIEAPASASVDAAVAAANRAVFAKLGAPQLPAVDRIYQAALAAIPDGPAKAAGIDVGERAAASVLDKRGDDVVQATETYRPMTTPGKYVPTMVPVAIVWGQRKPWHMSSPSEFRPGRLPSSEAQCGHATTTRSRPSAAARVRSAPPSRPRSPCSGRRRCRPSTTASCARSRRGPAARSRRTRGCSRRSRRRRTTR